MNEEEGFIKIIKDIDKNKVIAGSIIGPDASSLIAALTLNSGNLNFTFITTVQNKNLEKQLNVLKNALENFDIKIEVSGRNDLLCDGKKFSGHAFYEEDNFYYHHGTLMINVDTNMLSNILKPSKLKIL